MSTKLVTAEQGFVISDSIRTAWSVFKKDWITVYAVHLLPLFVAIVYGIISGIIGSNWLGSILMLAYLVVQFVVSMGTTKAFMEIIRSKKVSMETFTSVAPHALKFIGVQFLLGFIIFGGLLLFIVPGVIFSLKYMFAPYLVIDKGMGPIEALKASAEMTDGVKWDLIGFFTVLGVLVYLGLLALAVGLIVTIPVATLAYVVLYERLVKRLE